MLTMPKLTFAQRKKIEPLMRGIPKEAKILEVGCASGWLRPWLRDHNWRNYTGLDIHPPADFVGDVRNWRLLGVPPASYDVLIALEVVEHVVAYQEFFDILKPGGWLLISSPVPHMDWLCKILEWIAVNQERTSPHRHLIYFRDIPLFERVETWNLLGLVQVGKFRKPMTGV